MFAWYAAPQLKINLILLKRNYSHPNPISADRDMGIVYKSARQPPLFWCGHPLDSWALMVAWYVHAISRRAAADSPNWNMSYIINKIKVSVINNVVLRPCYEQGLFSTPPTLCGAVRFDEFAFWLSPGERRV